MVDSLIGLLVGWLVWLNRVVGWLVGCLLMEFCSPQIGGKMPAEEGSAESESPVKGKKTILYSQLCRCSD